MSDPNAATDGQSQPDTGTVDASQESVDAAAAQLSGDTPSDTSANNPPDAGGDTAPVDQPEGDYESVQQETAPMLATRLGIPVTQLYDLNPAESFNRETGEILTDTVRVR